MTNREFIQACQEALLPNQYTKEPKPPEFHQGFDAPGEQMAYGEGISL